MQHTTGSLSAHDGLQLFTQTWQPDEPSRASLLLVHGINEHSGRYAYMASHLVAHGIAVYSYDHRGHGQSPGPRVYVDSFDEYVDDLAIVFRNVREQTSGLPLFLMGHSLGGLIASLFVVNHRPELHALILSSPALRIPPDLSPLAQKIVGIISRVTPRLLMGKLEIQHISRDKAVQEAYCADPLTNNKGIRARMGFESLQAMKRVRQHPEAFTMPLYLFHGTADRITDPNGSKWLYAEAPSADKSLRLFDGLFHETMNEPERDEVLAELSDWITARL